MDKPSPSPSPSPSPPPRSPPPLSSQSGAFKPTPRTRLHRRAARGSYDRALAYAILDEALVCSVGFLHAGQPYVIPMAFARWDDRLVLHGAPANRLLAAAAHGDRGRDICVTVMLVDGLVLARSAMHHSLNYRSVVVLGACTEIVDEGEKRQALDRVVDHVLPGRSKTARPPNARELAATRVLALPIAEASVKVRSGGPLDDEDDLAHHNDCWAGQLPLRLGALPPIPDAGHEQRPVPPALLGYARHRQEA